jgi:predicted metal-dependent hydrolase
MIETIHLDDIAIVFSRKEIKHVHLSVHPPYGHVSLVAPKNTRIEVARAYAISKLSWIRTQQKKLLGQSRETPRQFIERESHYLWGRRYLLSVIEREEKPSVQLGHRHITLNVRPGSLITKREEVMQTWQRTLLHELIPKLIKKWEPKIGISVSGYFLQRMKTQWGACNPLSRTIRLNTELVKKPKDLLEYVIVHEMLHLIEPRHNERFQQLLTAHFPTWRESRAELNDLPLTAEVWNR